METVPLQKKIGSIEFLNTLSRCYSGGKSRNTRIKLFWMGLEKVAKTKNISKNELNQAKKLQKNQ